MAFLTTDAHLIGYQDSGETYLPALFMAHPLGMSVMFGMKSVMSYMGIIVVFAGIYRDTVVAALRQRD